MVGLSDQRVSWPFAQVGEPAVTGRFWGEKRGGVQGFLEEGVSHGNAAEVANE